MATRIPTANNVVGQKENVKVKNNIVAKNTARAALGDIGNKAVNNAKPQIVKKVAKDIFHLETAVLKDKVEKVLPINEEKSIAVPKSFSNHLLDFEDIDKNDGNDPQMVSEFVNDIYDYLRNLELKYPIKSNYLSGKQINSSMRAILIDWLVQVHQRFRLLPETMYLTVTIIDRYLQINNTTRSKLQLVGVTSMFIASKYEEIYEPEIGDFVYITANAYTKIEIRRMEIAILKSLNFSFGRPLPLHFLRRNSKAGKVDSTMHTFAKYLMELTLIEYNMVHHPPSKIAAAALCIARKVLENKSWTDTLIHYSKYTEEDLHPVMMQMAKSVIKAENNELSAIRTKYASSNYLKISTIPEIKSDVMKSLASGNFS